jgi:hypothetical protein
MRFVEHRVGDRRVLRLIRKWLKAGVVEDGAFQPAERGTPQGAVISPLLANIYLHYAYDLWVQQWRQRHAQGAMIVVRYADDTVVGFEHRPDAERFLADLRDRLAGFGRELHPDKTRLIEFGRNAVRNRASRGESKPETFDFLRFTHICTRARRGGFLLARYTRRDRSGRGSRTSRRDAGAAGSRTSPNRENGWGASCADTSRIMPSRQTATPCRRFATMSSNSGDAPCAGAARETGRAGLTSAGSPHATCHSPGSPIPGRLNASASNTQGGSRMRESRPYGSVRGHPVTGVPTAILPARRKVTSRQPQRTAHPRHDRSRWRPTTARTAPTAPTSIRSRTPSPSSKPFRARRRPAASTHSGAPLGRSGAACADAAARAAWTGAGRLEAQAFGL